MKKLKLYILAILISFPAFYMQAQVIVNSGIRFSSVEVNRNGNEILMKFSISSINANLGTQEMVVLTPAVKSATGSIIREFPPIVITGDVRAKALSRALGFGSYEFPVAPQLIIKESMTNDIPIMLNMPYSEELHNATLIVKEERIGCACENEYTNEYDLLRPILPPIFNPNYNVSYITPPVEEVKRRSETYNARLNFRLNRYEILRDFENNAAVLAEVDKVINEVRNDKNLTVNEFQITGYASPEGNFNSNMKLSENRAKSFVNYLNSTYNIDPSMIKVDWKGEDWDGLRKVVADLNIADKESVLDIIDNESNIDVRKNKLKQLSGGETYRMLLRDYYPPLRRNEYTISYIARNFDLNEAKEQIKTKPNLLSLNEMFIVANSYPKDSREFRETFDIATRIYPDSPIARMNTASSALERGETDMAISQLQGIDLPEAWNNLAIAYIKKKDYERARQYFQRASDAGLGIATENADQLSKWLDTQF
ncbi:DUF3868 domain-containing protein [Prevotella sp. 10(H)]|uniref:OmpA family protein n=1 Tax=Prevotella sp. 10(H) TaxID=1158294 RepID=UPI0004A6AF8F|nr:DUF3868 domain-containing protein [Prevotella sp. 10(H)]